MPVAGLSEVKLYVANQILAYSMAKFRGVYQQPDYQNIGSTREGPSFNRNAKIYGGNHLIYASEDKHLVVYNLQDLERFAKGGEPGSVLKVQLPSEVQAISFLYNTFSKDRICVLTDDGRLVKVIYCEESLSIKREALIPDVINPSIILTDLVCHSDCCVVSAFNS